MGQICRAKERALQWHPAFYADLQIELEREAAVLRFENEHQLGTKPMEIDILVIKTVGGRRIKKNIGRIFRTYNIIEYKSPEDYISIDDYYKVYGYCCFYKANVSSVNSIPIQEITMTLVSHGYPGTLMEHLLIERGFEIEQVEPGIYYVKGDVLPIQIIVTGELSAQENFWLRCLTNRLRDAEDMRRLLHEFAKHQKDPLYQAVVDIVVRANQEKFREVSGMVCEALEELFKDEIDAMLDRAKREGRKLGEAEGRKLGEAEGRKLGEEVEGRKLGEAQVRKQAEMDGQIRVNSLNLALAGAGRIEDITKAACDREYQKKLFEEFGL